MNSMIKNTPIGQIPTDWNVSKIGELGQVITGSTPKTSNPEYYSNDGVLWASPADLGKSKYILKTNKTLTNIGFDLTRKLPPKSIMVTCIGSTIGKIGMTNSWMSTNQQINTIVCNENNCSEFYYYIMEHSAQRIKSLAGTQAVPLINKSDFSAISVVQPPIKEQQKIATILSLVDDKIEVINQQINETEQLKKGMMQRLLTNGNGHTEFKESPKGEIPKSWGLYSLYNLLNDGKTITYGIVQPGEYVSDGVYLIRSQDYTKGYWMPTETIMKVSHEIDKPYARSRVQEGDILITVVGANVGRIAVVPKELDKANISRSVARISINDELANPIFVRYYLDSSGIKNLIRLNQVGGAQPVLNLKEISKIKIPLPSRKEQDKIATTLELISSKSTILKEKKEQYSVLKKGLMQQLLTGKIRVDGTEN